MFTQLLRESLRFYALLWREHTRQLDYIFFTLLFPALFFLIFGVPEATDVVRANTLLASFSAFGVMGVVLFQLAVISAHERHYSWQLYLRSLPVPRLALVLGRLWMVISFSLVSIASVGFTAWTLTAIELDLVAYGKFVLILLAGSLPFALLGLLVGRFASPKGVIPLANLIYLSLSYAGGLWFPPQMLPEIVQRFSVYLPSRIYAELLWDLVHNRPLDPSNAQHLALQTLLLALVVSLLLGWPFSFAGGLSRPFSGGFQRE